MKHLIRKVLKEESLKSSLLDSVRENGWSDTAQYVGGSENLLKILGKSKETIMMYLMGHFDNLKSERYGRERVLSQNFTTIMDISDSELFGGELNVYDDYLRSIMEEVPKELYEN